MAKELEKTLWKIVLAWCPVCWWRQSSEFHIEVAESNAHRTLKSAHKKAKPKCAGPLKFEPAKLKTIK